MNVIEVTRATSVDRILQARTINEDPATSGDFLLTDSLSATVSRGEGYPSLFEPECSWTADGADVDTGKFGISIAQEDSDIEAGEYLLQVFVTRGSKTACIVRATVRVLGTTGLLEIPKVYCEYDDLDDELNWIGDVKDADKDLTNFLKQRGQAREWMVGLILKAQPRGGYGLVSYQDRWDWDFSGSNDVSGGNSLAADSVLRSYLDNDCLMLTTPYGRKIVEACTFWSLAKILARTGHQRANTSMGSLAEFYRQRANHAAIQCIAEIDTDGDGTCDIAISLGLANVRRK